MHSEAYKEVSDMQIVSSYSKQATEWLFSWGTQTTKEGVQERLSSGGSSGARRHRCSVNSGKQGRWVWREEAQMYSIVRSQPSVRTSGKDKHTKHCIHNSIDYWLTRSINTQVEAISKSSREWKGAGKTHEPKFKGLTCFVVKSKKCERSNERVSIFKETLADIV